MMVVGEDPKKWIEEYSRQFQQNFLQLLRTSHGEKPIQVNRFYQEYIADKTHVHLNATKWSSLSEFSKYLGREGICRVEEKEDGVFVQWIDNSPDAIRRRDAIQKAERLKDDESREQMELIKQVERAHQNKAPSAEKTEGEEKPAELSKEKWTGFGIGLKPANKTPEPAAISTPATTSQGAPAAKKPTNVFSLKRKKEDKPKSSPAPEAPKKMTEIERIMKEDMERKKRRRL
jgi:DNA/RNA-binding protein KIN17